MRFIGFSALFFSSLSQAWSAPSPPALGAVYLGATVGASRAKLSKSHPRISYESGVLITDAYPLKSNHAWSVSVNVNGGYEFTGAHWRPAIALGVGGYFTPEDYHFHGRVIETAEGGPSSTLYNYKYKINNTRVMAEIQLTWMLRYLSPFISFGVGPAWNKAESYKEKAVNGSGYPPISPFRSHTHLNCAYQAGLGISFGFNWCNRSGFLHERISLGYHYVHSGKTSFGTRGSAYPHRLDMGTLSSNDIYFTYTHLF